MTMQILPAFHWHWPAWLWARMNTADNAPLVAECLAKALAADAGIRRLEQMRTPHVLSTPAAKALNHLL